jgi:hypothetical protein
MERHGEPGAEGSAPRGFRDCPAWAICLLGLIAWQAWMTLSLFGPDASWEDLLDDRPIISGRHPLHLYHGYLGAQSFREHGSLCCYDPAYQAGYPKTPVFDSGSRLAELSLSIGGTKHGPAVYKIGLAACLLCVPILVVLATRGIGLGAGTSCLAGAAGVLVCWSGPGRGALEAGDVDLLMAGLAALLLFGSLIQFHRLSSVRAWLGLVLSGCLGWLANPLFFAALIPLVLLYYLSVGARHDALGWHAALIAGLLAGVAVNSFWLIDWVKYWWIRVPQEIGDSILPHRTFQTIWNAPLWGDAIDRSLAVGLFGLAFAGVVFLNQDKQRPAARLLGLGYLGFLALTILGIASESLGRLGTARLLVPALWLAVVPAAHALAVALRWLGRHLGSPWCPAALVAGLLVTGCLVAPDLRDTLADRFSHTVPLAIGLGSERAQVVRTLISSTGPEARILWEDCPDAAGAQCGQRWTCLLALTTGRSFLGGLDPEVGIEHSHAGLVDQKLAGMPIVTWTPEQLEGFCKRYNVGWIVCWSSQAQQRIAAWSLAESPPIPLAGNPAGCLFKIKRSPSFATAGQARLIQADCRHITLADLVPDKDGKVVLCFHHQAGLQASPSRVQVERETDPFDPIPFIRLRVSGPVARVTLTWEGR